jgi:hypothetical protein
MYVAAMLARKSSTGLEPTIAALVNSILTIYRVGIALGLEDQTGVSSLPSVELSDTDTMKLMGAIIASGDQRGMPFPINNWYS